MTSRDKKRINYSIGASLVLGALSGFVGVSERDPSLFQTVNLFVLLIAAILYLYGLYSYSKAKGYPGWLGVVLGILLNLIGLVVLVFLPDRSKKLAD